MQNNSEPQAIIDYLNEKIKKDERRKDFWEENYQQHMAEHYHTMAVNRIAAFKEVLEFINENFNDND